MKYIKFVSNVFSNVIFNKFLELIYLYTIKWFQAIQPN